MPRTTNPDKYPASFYDLLTKVSNEGEVFIPHDHPRSFRGYLQSFLRAVELNDKNRAEEAKAMMVRLAPDEKGVIVCDRDRSPNALAVRSALGDSQTRAVTETARSKFLDLLDKANSGK